MHSLLAIKVHIKVGLVLSSKTETVADKTSTLLILWLDTHFSPHLHLCRASPLLPPNFQNRNHYFLINFITVNVSNTKHETLGKLF